MIKKLTVGTIILVAAIIAYNLVVQITSALSSEKRLSAQAEAVYKLEAQNRKLQDQLKAVTTKEFIEAQARNELGLAKPGETLVIIPEDKLKAVMGVASQSAKPRLANWLGWWEVFFR